jgi:hypothetical protein
MRGLLYNKKEVITHTIAGQVIMIMELSCSFSAEMIYTFLQQKRPKTPNYVTGNIACLPTPAEPSVQEGMNLHLFLHNLQVSVGKGRTLARTHALPPPSLSLSLSHSLRLCLSCRQAHWQRQIKGKPGHHTLSHTHRHTPHTHTHTHTHRGRETEGEKEGGGR